jgi:hypothetical protein
LSRCRRANSSALQSASLLLRRFGGQRLRDHGLAGELGVGADEGELRLAARLAHRAHQRELERGEARERPRGRGPRGDPRRMLVDAVEQGDEFAGAGGVELLEGRHGALLHVPAHALYGCVCRQ